METATKEIALHIIHPVSFRKFIYRKLIERFGKLYINMYRSYLSMHAIDDSLMYQPFTMPRLFLVGNDRKIHAPVHHRSEDVGLRKGLSILLSYPGFGSVGRNHDDRYLLIICLADSRIEIEQCRTGSDAYCHWSRTRSRIAQGNAHSHKTGTALIGNRIAGNSLRFIEIMYDRRIATSRANHHPSHTMRL